MGKRVAIVGSGCSGIGALWALKNTDHEVHLFEKSGRLGGHTNTVQYEAPNGSKVNVDTGFIVMNTATYRECFSHSPQLHCSILLSQLYRLSQAYWCPNQGNRDDLWCLTRSRQIRVGWNFPLCCLCPETKSPQPEDVEADLRYHSVQPVCPRSPG